jgi:hypothetical protein
LVTINRTRSVPNTFFEIPVFEINFEKAVECLRSIQFLRQNRFRAPVFEIPVFEIKPSSHKMDSLFQIIVILFELAFSLFHISFFLLEKTSVVFHSHLVRFHLRLRARHLRLQVDGLLLKRGRALSTITSVFLLSIKSHLLFVLL